jgi:hypothetical protein
MIIRGVIRKSYRGVWSSRASGVAGSCLSEIICSTLNTPPSAVRSKCLDRLILWWFNYASSTAEDIERRMLWWLMIWKRYGRKLSQYLWLE